MHPIRHLQDFRTLVKDGRIPEHVTVLMLDRTLSPTGERQLKNRRLETSAWPNPRVYSATQIAKALLRAYEQRAGRVLSPRVMHPLEVMRQIYDFICADWDFAKIQQVPASAILNEWRVWKSIERLGLGFADAEQLIRSLEQNNSDTDLKLWSQRLLNWLKIRGTAHNPAKPEKEPTDPLATSDWNLIEYATESSLTGSYTASDITNALRLPSASSAELWVLAYREAFPLERKPIEVLSKFMPVHWFHEPPTTAPRLKELKEQLQAHAANLASKNSMQGKNPGAVQAAESSLVWMLPDATPGPLERLYCFNPEQLQFHPSRSVGDTPPVRAIKLWIDFHQSKHQSSHLFSRYQSTFEPVLTSIGLDLKVAPSWKQLCQLNSEHPSYDMLNSRPPRPQDLASWCEILNQSGYFQNLGGNAPGHLAAGLHHPLGQRWIQVEDLQGYPWERIDIVGSPDDVIEHCDPISPRNQSREVFPQKVQELLEQNGIAVPQVQNECQELATFVSQNISLIHFQKYPFDLPPRFGPPPSVPRTLPRSHFSMTAIESYLRCPRSYYFQKIHKFDSSTDWDSLEMQARDKGTWIHKALQNFAVETLRIRPTTSSGYDWKKVLSECLQASLEGFTLEEKFSETYLNLRKMEIPSLTQRLARHVLGFEMPTVIGRPGLELKMEEEIKTDFLNTPFRGFVDRIDVTPNGFFIWDYKSSGQYRYQKPQKWLEHNHFQVLYYAQTWQKLSELPLLGFGYLNVFQAEQSGIYLTERGANHPLPIDDLPVQLIDDSTLKSLLKQLEASCLAAIQEINTGTFPAKPKAKATCHSCQFQGICGRPFLEFQSDD